MILLLYYCHPMLGRICIYLDSDVCSLFQQLVDWLDHFYGVVTDPSFIRLELVLKALGWFCPCLLTDLYIVIGYKGFH